jgi:phosphoribosylpyrophosphate synthetase
VLTTTIASHRTIIPLLISAVPLFQTVLRAKIATHPEQEFAIAFPDDGAFKRFHKLFNTIHIITCAKVRDGDKRIVRIKEGEASGKHVYIVDDLVQSGIAIA